VNGYGGKKRRVELVSETGHWYKGGAGLVPVRWVFVHDVDGSHPRRILTADGEVEIPRRYFWATAAGGAYPVDRPAGIEQDTVSPGAQQILCRLGMVQDFAQAAEDATAIGHGPVSRERLR